MGRRRRKRARWPAWVLLAAAIALAWYLELRGCVPPKADDYDRKDEGCRDTRQEVLVVESLTRVRFGKGKRDEIPELPTAQRR